MRRSFARAMSWSCCAQGIATAQACPPSSGSWRLWSPRRPPGRDMLHAFLVGATGSIYALPARARRSRQAPRLVSWASETLPSLCPPRRCGTIRLDVLRREALAVPDRARLRCLDYLGPQRVLPTAMSRWPFGERIGETIVTVVDGVALRRSVQRPRWSNGRRRPARPRPGAAAPLLDDEHLDGADRVCLPGWRWAMTGRPCRLRRRWGRARGSARADAGAVAAASPAQVLLDPATTGFPVTYDRRPVGSHDFLMILLLLDFKWL